MCTVVYGSLHAAAAAIASTAHRAPEPLRAVAPQRWQFALSALKQSWPECAAVKACVRACVCWGMHVLARLTVERSPMVTHLRE